MSVIIFVTSWLWISWALGYGIWQLTRAEWLREVLLETRPAFRAITVLKMAVWDVSTAIPDAVYWLPFYWAADLIWIFILSKDLGDDDRWKRRRKKAAAKVKEVAGRLVVVPELAPASVK